MKRILVNELKEGRKTYFSSKYETVNRRKRQYCNAGGW